MKSPLLDQFEQVGEDTGGFVRLMPVVVGTDGQPIAVSQVMAAMVDHLDYARLAVAFPSLSVDQMKGGLLFLQKLCE